MHRKSFRLVCGAAVIAVLASLLMQPMVGAVSPEFDDQSPNWVGAWGVAPEQAHYPAAAFQSFRMIVHPTIGGEAVRLRFSNEFGDRPVRLRSVSVARRTRGRAVDPATSVPVDFTGRRSIIVPAHGLVVSDPVPFRYRYGDDLAVTFFVPGSVPQVTGHGYGAGIVTSYATAPGTGDATSDASGASFSVPTTDKYFLMGVDSYAPGALGTVVAFGDSITDGTASTTDGYDTWPDVLAARLQAAGVQLGVVNAGIGGNTVLRCGSPLAFGEPGVDRFDRDVLHQPNVRVVLVNEGGNDLRFCPVTGADVAVGIQSLVDRSHEAGVAAIVTTYTPHVARIDVGTSPPDDQSRDAQRQVLNEWIRDNATHFDGVVDFDAALRDGSAPSRLRPDSHSFDGVHPGPPGLRMMAESVPLALLLQLAQSHAAGRA